MLVFKKLIFSIPFLLSFAAFIYFLNPFLKNPYFLISFDLNNLTSILILVLILLLTGFFYIIFSTLALDFKIVLPIALLASLISLPLIPNTNGLILAIGSFIAFASVFIFLNEKLKTYLDFKPTTLLIPSIKQTVTFLLLISSIAFYLASANHLKEKGFSIPDSLIDFSLSLALSQEDANLSRPSKPPQNLSISQEQINLLKQNPEILKQYGLDPAILDQIEPQTEENSSQPSANNLLKSQVKSQFENIITPYKNYIPIILTILFFLTLQPLASILSLLLYPLIWFIFYILNKTGFTKYQVEMRAVKKLVV